MVMGIGGALPVLPEGFSFLVDENGNYVTDESNGYYIAVRTE